MTAELSEDDRGKEGEECTITGSAITEIVDAEVRLREDL